MALAGILMHLPFVWANPNLLNQKVIFVLPLINKYKPIYIDFGYFFRYKWLS
jgi:hypothetical protein